jgi:hypothetical protein
MNFFLIQSKMCQFFCTGAFVKIELFARIGCDLSRPIAQNGGRIYGTVDFSTVP